MKPIDGIMVPGMCPPMRPKALKCPSVDETSAAMPRNDGVADHTQIGSNTPETGLTAENGVPLAILPDSHSIEVYKNGKSTITLTIDPIVKKDFRFEWTYKLSEVDVNAGYEVPLGFTDGSADAVFNVAAL